MHQKRSRLAEELEALERQEQALKAAICGCWAATKGLSPRSAGSFVSTAPSWAVGQSTRHSAYEAVNATVAYRWHPLFGQRLRLREGARRGRIDVVLVGAGRRRRPDR